MPKKKLYSSDDLEQAIHLYNTGMKIKYVCMRFPNIPRCTLMEQSKKAREHVDILKPGPKPLLTDEMENDLQAWIVAMQSSGLPVSRDMILVKGNKIYCSIYGNTRSTGFLGRGWLDRFMK
jgi:hypothetical protein